MLFCGVYVPGGSSLGMLVCVSSSSLVSKLVALAGAPPRAAVPPPLPLFVVPHPPDAPWPAGLFLFSTIHTPKPTSARTRTAEISFPRTVKPVPEDWGLDMIFLLQCAFYTRDGVGVHPQCANELST